MARGTSAMADAFRKGNLHGNNFAEDGGPAKR
jgi:hypothetical protein